LLKWKDCFFLDFIAIAALRRNQNQSIIKYTETERQLMKNKILSIFIMADIHHHDSLVLGAFGCGCFHNDPKQVAELFNEVMNENKKIIAKFSNIVFAVLSMRTNNFQVFNENINR
jgi:uncharacterized protein (TIGR02452 family)